MELHNETFKSQNSMCTRYLLKDNKSFIQISFTNLQQQIISMKTPAFKIFSNCYQCEFRFLSYKTSNESQNRFSRIVKLITQTTPTLILNPLWTRYDFIVSDKVIFINQYDQELMFMCTLPKAFWANKALLPINNISKLCKIIQGENDIHLCFKIQENTELKSLERYIDNYFVKIEVLDKRILQDIALELKQKDLRFKEQNNEIVYYKAKLSFRRFRKYKVQINVKNGIVGINFFIDADANDIKYFSEQGFNNLKKYFSIINNLIDFGIFSCSFETMEIFYSINYHDFRSFESSEQKKPHPEILFLMQKYLDIYSLHLENIYKILVQDIPLEEVIENGKILKCPKQQDQKIVKSLSPEEAFLEKKIIKCLNSSIDHFFSSRFKYNSIQFDNDSFIYNSPCEGETFAQIYEELSSEAIDSIIELAEELAMKGLYLKGNKFPVENFLWVLQRPTYTYNAPLHKLLEIREQENCTNYIRSLLEDLQMIVLSMHREKVKKLCGFKNVKI